MNCRSDSLDDISFESEIIDKKSSYGDGTSCVNTEASLLSSKASSQSIHRDNQLACCPKEELKKKCRDPKFKIIVGTLLLIWGVCTLVWPPLDLMMDERLRMRPGLPPYEWWKNPPDEVLLRVYVFNVTNAERFMSGEDAKLKLQEIGPIVFREKLIHSNVTFNDNDTMSYVATRKAIYLPEENHIDLNQTIFVPNLAVLGMASYFWDSAFFEKWAFNMLVRSANSDIMVNISIHNYLWNYTDPIVEMARSIAPALVPVNNMGILSRIYDDFQDTVTVYIGTDRGDENYFLIDRYDGSEYLPGHGSSCQDKIMNSTEGVAYPQYLTKNSSLRYWRKTMCKVTTLYFDSEQEWKYGINSYKFWLPNNTFDRTQPEEKDCYRSESALPNGLSDISKCYFDIPVATSFPHFLYFPDLQNNNVDGLTPNETEHGSFVLVEPMTGIPLNSRARSQSNLVVRPLDGFKEEIERFSNTVIPMFWAEYIDVST
ncbi:hypothetical protein HHI36_021232 [Cryptolaemus montrouzieri]|uniref:Uncharacterized protein n=1 Tax=Cryptolaemus montrouzieri TaxID=559131 RepID=A0ABD2MWC1_9CUCU